jgi:CDP-diacylglycerol--glycerol-3-phosphate 3-phosphatidyltransferase
MSQPPIHPNTLTAMRLPLAPLAVACMMHGSLAGLFAAAALALLLEVTDIADGWIARRYEVVSDFGKLFDPFSDAFCRFTLFMGLYAIGQADLWMVLAIYYRDSTVAFLRTIAATQRIVISARQSGKFKAVVQAIGTQVCFLALVAPALRPELQATLAPVPWWTMLLVTLVTLYSLVDYLSANRHIFAVAWASDRAR